MAVYQPLIAQGGVELIHQLRIDLCQYVCRIHRRHIEPLFDVAVPHLCVFIRRIHQGAQHRDEPHVLLYHANQHKSLHVCRAFDCRLANVLRRDNAASDKSVQESRWGAAHKRFPHVVSNEHRRTLECPRGVAVEVLLAGDVKLQRVSERRDEQVWFGRIKLET